MTCTECGQIFGAYADEFGDVPDVCPRCVRERTREAVPELLGDTDDDGDEYLMYDPPEG